MQMQKPAREQGRNSQQMPKSLGYQEGDSPFLRLTAALNLKNNRPIDFSSIDHSLAQKEVRNENNKLRKIPRQGDIAQTSCISDPDETPVRVKYRSLAHFITASEITQDDSGSVETICWVRTSIRIKARNCPNRIIPSSDPTRSNKFPISLNRNIA